MKKYRKKPIVIEAVQWFKNGDHPEDNCMELLSHFESHPKGILSEGKIVRHYRTPALNGQDKCKKCKKMLHNHGWVDTLEGGHIVCPGDWIITGVEGEHYPIKNDIFLKTYERVDRPSDQRTEFENISEEALQDAKKVIEGE